MIKVMSDFRTSLHLWHGFFFMSVTTPLIAGNQHWFIHKREGGEADLSATVLELRKGQRDNRNFGEVEVCNSERWE